MPTGLERYYGRGQLHFVTFSCYRRLALLATAWARNMFVKELSRVRREYGFLLVGYVVMPNHVHLLMSEPKKGHAVDSDADAQATGFANDEEEGACELEGAASTSISQVCRGGATVLAAEVLRFQRVQSQEEKGKTGVHARESGGARAREAPEGLAVEQFLFLREKRSRIGGDRCSGFVETPNQGGPMKKPRPPKPRTGHPKLSNDLRPATHPPRLHPNLFDISKELFLLN